jgi:hypothetical protein
MPRHPYYVYDKVCSYNGVYNFLVGGRGIGKTYGAKRRAIKAAIYKGDQFIYLRRYKTEMTPARNTFFADISHLFPKWDFRVVGPEAQTAPARTRDSKKRQWRTIGYFVTLSTAQTQKSVSYEHVKTIIFDEFIIENGALHYLPDEATIFTNFYSTVDRYKDKTVVWFLANSVSIMNPYFLEYEIRPDQESEFIVKNDGFIVCHFPESAAFATSVYETRFGKFIKNTEYADYAVANTFEDNHENLLAGKDSKSKYLFSLECRNGIFSVWHNWINDEYFIQAKRPKNEPHMFTLLADKMDTNKNLVTLNDGPLQYLRTAFRSGRVSFDAPQTRNTFAEIFKR